MKIRSHLDDNLPLKQELEIQNIMIIIMSIFYDNYK